MALINLVLIISCRWVHSKAVIPLNFHAQFFFHLTISMLYSYPYLLWHLSLPYWCQFQEEASLIPTLSSGFFFNSIWRLKILQIIVRNSASAPHLQEMSLKCCTVCCLKKTNVTKIFVTLGKNTETQGTNSWSTKAALAELGDVSGYAQ